MYGGFSHSRHSLLIGIPVVAHLLAHVIKAVYVVAANGERKQELERLLVQEQVLNRTTPSKATAPAPSAPFC